MVIFTDILGILGGKKEFIGKHKKQEQYIIQETIFRSL